MRSGSAVRMQLRISINNDTSGAMGTPAQVDFCNFFRRHHKRLETYLYGRVRCRATAADLAQEAFLRLWRLGEGELRGDAKGYLLQTAKNLAIDHLRASRVRTDHATGVLAVQLMVEEALPDARLEARQELAILNHGLRELGSRTRIVFLLHKIYGWNHTEIASALGISKSAVEKHMLRAMRHCRHRLACHR